MRKRKRTKTIGQLILNSRQRRVTISEAERKNVFEGVVFGYMHSKWNRFKAKLRKGDELWYFRTPEETWTGFPHMGLEGYAIVRRGALVETLITSIS